MQYAVQVAFVSQQMTWGSTRLATTQSDLGIVLCMTYHMTRGGVTSAHA